MKVRYTFLVLFLCCPVLLFAQNKPYSKLSHSDSLAIVMADKMLTKAIEDNDELKKGQALYLKGKAILSTSSIKALEYFKQATKIFENTNNEALKDIYYDESQIHTLFSEFPEALSLGLKSLEYNKINAIEENVLRDMSSIGYIYDRMYDFKESIKWNREALKLAKKLNDKKGEALCYGRIGIAFDELAERDNFNKRLFDSALFYNKKAAKMSELVNDLAQARTSYSNIGNTYSKLKDYKKAEEYTLKSLKVPGFDDRKGVTLVNLGKIYLETNRFQEAKKILDSAMQNTLKYGTRKYQLEAYYRYHELDVKKGDYKNALNNYIEYKSIEDSLLNETKTRQIAEMGERYKTADKEREILTQRAELAEKSLTIQKRDYQLYGLLGLALILGFIGYLFYNQQKLKNHQLQKENELKDALLKIETQSRLQEQRLRISRDLHDNIGAQLTFIISSIDNLKYGFDIKDEKLNKKLDDISSFTSATIYELRDTIWAMNKSEITFEDLQTRISNYIDKAHLSDDKIEFSFIVDDNVDTTKKFSSVEGMNIHRIIQEAIHNSLKYADASSIKVLFKTNKANLEISIIDDGKGFDETAVELGNGINNMKKRAYDINATFLIDSKLNNGTIVSIYLPLKIYDK
ncbi:tetratricopeptide repeat-containing sensor histidine kinase [Aquaticitalea lipolytica]|uniref:tetratricopeptide repeat-containing sensor histidine kinase n=1 Tax=Aquaticitalea lipolytica TaxID=1247562 RepID=UPI0024BB9B34|nr:tetratricopeptide repeat-containing sensor histidine kinase [Aquaticitalea lipolytica]